MSSTIRNGFTKKTIYMMQLPEETDDNEFIMVIADPRINQQGLAGWHIEQSNNKSYRPDVVFQVKGKISINMQNIKETLEVECKEEGGRFIIPFQEYNRVKEELKDPSESSEEEDEDSSEEESVDEKSETSEEDFEQADQPQEVKKRGRPKGSRNKKRLMAEESFEDDDEFAEEQKRGRGRPKGSKNKKLQSGFNKKDEDHKDELKMLMEGYMKRGKGRPKGSKNKPKGKGDRNSDDDENKDGGDPNANFWKRGKGRPRGSKNKIKNIHNDNLTSSLLEVKQKRNRGRPPGVKNKPRSEPSISESSQNQNIGEIPEFPTFEDEYQDCCNRCHVGFLRRKLMRAKSVEEAREVIEEYGTANLAENFHPQRRQNLFILALQRNNSNFLQLLLNHKNDQTEYLRCCWDVNGIQQDRFIVRTRKQFLSKSGKQKIQGLLHDCISRSSEVWWKQLTSQRILESLPDNCNKDILETLRKNDENLYYQLYTNIAHVIRAGNYHVAVQLLSHPPAKIEAQFYTRQHLQFLKNESQLQFKKANVLKRNLGSNFCSPIHCAAINPNKDVLENLIKNTINYNINDSYSRKPIHYAAACQNPSNLEVLIRYGADVRDLDKFKMSPLMIACYYGRLENVKYILQKCNQPLYVNHRSEEGYSALHYAVLRGYPNILRHLLDEPSTNVSSETREKQTSLHLVAGTGNVEIFTMLIGKGLYVDAIDKFRRTPLMLAIRNHNHALIKQMLKEQPKMLKTDSSGNTLLHYAAAYGNLHVLKFLLGFIKQTQNKEGFHPWEISIGKGHLACSKYLRNQSTVEGGQLLCGQTLEILMLKSLTGSKEGLRAVRTMLSSYPVSYKVLDQNENSPLHIICSISEEEYTKQRLKEIDNTRIIKQEFKGIFEELIPILINKGIERDRQNRNHETALTISLENGNLTAMKQLLPNVIDLGYDASNGISMINFLAMLASLGADETKLVHDRLEKENKATVVRALRGVNDDEPLLNFVKHFAWRVKANYHEELESSNPNQNVYHSNESRTKAFKKLLEHQNCFIKLMAFFEAIGANFQVRSKIPYEHGWSVIHYIMQFPSVRILEHFKKIIKDFNPLTTEGVSPLHLFCQVNNKDSLVDIDLRNDYTGERSLRWLLENGCDVNILDKDNSSAMHYAALNKQIGFIMILMEFKGQINVINKNNKVPFIELIKLKDNFTIDQFEELLKMGANPNFSDKNKRSPLHHLVSHSRNFDSSPRLCKLLEANGAEINSLDEHNRTPLFYCFIDIDDENLPTNAQSSNPKNKRTRSSSDDESANDRLEIVQTIINFEKVDLKHMDVQGRTAIHYACQKNYFFSILYLLDKNIDINIEDNQGNTPLAICLIHKNLNQAALLLKKGTAMGYVNENGKRMTYFAYALSNSLIEICHLLLDHGYPPEEALKQEIVKNNEALRKIIQQKCKIKPEVVAQLF